MSKDGRTYTFTIRPGMRFSPPSNQLVTAQTFKHTIERSLQPAMSAPAAGRSSATSSACPRTSTGKARHIAGIGHAASGSRFA